MPAKTQCLPVTLVHAQGGGAIGARPACAQALHGAQVEESVPGDPLPALGREAGIAGWGDSDLCTLGFQAALKSVAEDEEDIWFWKGRQDMKASHGLWLAPGLQTQTMCFSHVLNRAVLTVHNLRGQREALLGSVSRVDTNHLYSFPSPLSHPKAGQFYTASPALHTAVPACAVSLSSGSVTSSDVPETLQENYKNRQCMSFK